MALLYGRANPGRKSPFTWGKVLADYEDPMLVEPNNGHGAPQDDFSGVFIDYRRFDKDNETPIYEFGHCLSYTSFSFSDLKVRKLRARPYTPTKGLTRHAPTLGHPPGDTSDYLYPSWLKRIEAFIYPWLNSTNLKQSTQDPDYGMENSEYLPDGSTDGSLQHRLPASGAPGGNKGLYEDVFEVTVKVKNTGKVAGDEVPQLVRFICDFSNLHELIPAVCFPWWSPRPREGAPPVRPDYAWKLRGEGVEDHSDTTRRLELGQNWVISDYPKTVHVGSSSRKLPLQAKLDKIE